DFRDPWITNQPAHELTPGLRCQRCLEGRVMRGATVLIANTPLNQQGWAEAYPDVARKIVTVTNGFDPERFVPQAPSPARSHGVIRILHAGELYHERDPRPLLDALSESRTQGQAADVKLEFLGRQSGRRFDLAGEIRVRGLEPYVSL